MKKIAIIRCLITSASCAGAGCLRAFNSRTKGFSCYDEKEELQLAAVWTCNGCGKSKLENQDGIRKKIERMKTEKIDALHLSHCTHKKKEDGVKYLCPTIRKIADELEGAGIAIVDGTH